MCSLELFKMFSLKPESAYLRPGWMALDHWAKVKGVGGNGLLKLLFLMMKGRSTSEQAPVEL